MPKMRDSSIRVVPVEVVCHYQIVVPARTRLVWPGYRTGVCMER